MRNRSLPGTQWFMLSGHEVVLLAAAAGILLLGLGGVRLYRAVWRPADLSVRQHADALPMPARLNVNTAPDYELMMLPGIGPKMARAIVEYRRANGPFRRLDELTNVPGIGPKTLAGIRPFAMCSPPPEKAARREGGGG